MTTERNSQIEKAVVKLCRLSADEQARYIFDMHEKARRDEESLLRWARIEGQQEGRLEGEIKGKFYIAKNMAENAEPIEKIIRYTGLSKEEVEKLVQQQRNHL